MSNDGSLCSFGEETPLEFTGGGGYLPDSGWGWKRILPDIILCEPGIRYTINLW